MARKSSSMRRNRKLLEMSGYIIGAAAALVSSILLGGGWYFLLLLIPIVIIAARVAVLVHQRNREIYLTRISGLSNRLLAISRADWERVMERVDWLRVKHGTRSELVITITPSGLGEDYERRLDSTSVMLVLYPWMVKYSRTVESDYILASVLPNSDLVMVQQLMEEIQKVHQRLSR